MKPYLNVNLLKELIKNADSEKKVYAQIYYKDLLNMNEYNVVHNIKLEKVWVNGDYWFKIYDHNTRTYHIVEKDMVIE